MVSWCSHLITEEQGVFYALKGQYPKDEIASLPENIKMIQSDEIIVPALTGDRHLIQLQKIKL